MSNDLTKTALGKHADYPQSYDKSVLQPIPRLMGRKSIGLPSPLPFVGEDIWNAYEVSWLNLKGKPEVALLELRVSCDSPSLVESKSFKLYLGSYNQSRFSSPEEVQQKIREDLSELLSASVQVKLCPLSAAGSFAITRLPGSCIDNLDIACNEFQVNPSLLAVNSQQKINDLQLYSHLLRSCCPVTGQPDWASVVIRYSGDLIENESLLRYLVSYRNNQEFHEQCVERIFWDLWTHCHPSELLVMARFTRRGGIDINPVRSSAASIIENMRTIRQ